MRPLLSSLLVALTIATAAACGSESGTANPAAQPADSPTLEADDLEPAAPDPTTASSTTAPTAAGPTTVPTVVAPTTAPVQSGDASGAIAWFDSTKVASLGDGWTIAACEGEAPFLCVADDGTVVATLEMLRFPVASFTIVDPVADLATNIGAIADDFVASIGADRAATCGDGYVFEPLPVEPFSFGEQPAYRYGYRATLADGSPSEFNLQYATIVGDEIVLVTAIAYDEGGCPGRDDQSGFDTAMLTELQDEIEAVLRGSPLPGEQ